MILYRCICANNKKKYKLYLSLYYIKDLIKRHERDKRYSEITAGHSLIEYEKLTEKIANGKMDLDNHLILICL